MEFLRRGFKTIGFRGDYHLGLMDEHHVLIRFQLNEDYQRCWLHQIWKFKTYTMRVLKWTPFFHKDEEPPISPIWVSFENLPLFMFKREALFSAGQIIGKPLKLDIATETLSRPSVARLCVETDLLKPLPRRFWIGQGATGFWQPIKYEAIPKYCFGCRRFGHLEENCGQKETATLITQAWRQKTPTARLESAAGIDKELPEVNLSVVQLDNEIGLQNNTLDLDLAVKPVLEGGSMPSNAANPMNGKHSSQPARRNDTEVDNLQNSESSDAAVTSENAVAEKVSSPTATELPEVNLSEVQLENVIALQNSKVDLELDAAVKLIMAGGSMPSSAANLMDGKHSSQPTRLNTTEADNLKNLESSAGALASENVVVAEVPSHTASDLLKSIMPGLIACPPDVSSDISNAVGTNLVTTERLSPELPSEDKQQPQDDLDVQQKSFEIQEGSISLETPKECAVAVLSTAQVSAILQSALNPFATEFVSTYMTSPVPSAPSPVQSNIDKENLNDLASTSLSAPAVMGSEKSQPTMLSPVGLQIHYPTVDYSHGDWESLHSSENDEEYEEDDFWDQQLVRDESFLDHKKAKIKSRERERIEIQFRRGRGRPPGFRRTYFEAVRTIRTRSNSLD